MKIFLYIAAFLIFSFNAYAMDGRIAFFSSVPDLPLMNGLSEQPSETLIFDKAEGRIVEVYASLDDLEAAQVASYYESVLPSFGWKRAGEGLYDRDSERLSLLFEQGGQASLLHITITPK